MLGQEACGAMSCMVAPSMNSNSQVLGIVQHWGRCTPCVFAYVTCRDIRTCLMHVSSYLDHVSLLPAV
jgi:hypothetical protein